MRIRKIVFVFLIFIMLFLLTSCSKSDYMMGEGSFEDIAKSFKWFFNTLTPAIFHAIGEA